MQVKRFASLLPIVTATGIAVFMTLAMPATNAGAQPAPAGSGGAANPLPTNQNAGGAVTTITVQGGSRSLFKIAVTSPLGDSAIASQLQDTSTRDLTL